MARRAKGEQPRSAWLELESLKNVQVWRFSLYYFFVFGAFVALALWLPRYLIGVYGLDIETAGMLGAAYSIPASLFRAYGGHLSDKYGARRIMYWMFGVSVLITFILAYPPTEYIVQGIKGPIHFHLATGVVTFTALIFVLGFFMSLGKAAVYKHIPVYYPEQCRRGRRPGRHDRRPRRLRAADRLRRAQRSHRHLDQLLHAAVRHRRRVARCGCISPSSAWSARRCSRACASCRNSPRWSRSTRRSMSARSPGMCSRTGGRKIRRSGTSKGRAIARRNLWISIPALLLAFAVWMVWSVVVAKLPAVGFKFTTDQLFWLAAMPGLSGATLRIFYSFMPPIFGGRLWTSIATWSLMIPAVGIGLAVQNPDTPYIFFLSLALLCGFGGGNFASSMANISFFFPKAEKGNALALNAGLGNLGVSVVQFVIPLVITAGVFGWLGGDPQGAVEADRTTQLWLQNAGFVWVPFIAASAIAAWFGMNDIAAMRGLVRRPGGDLPAQAQLDHVLALHRHLRLVHRLFGRLPAARQDPVPGGRFAQARLPRAAGRRAVALGDRLDRPTATAAAASPSGCSC